MDERIKTEEDLEAILKLAVQEPREDLNLRSRLNLAAAELGISDEQLRTAEETYFAKREQEEAELKEKQEAATKRRQDLVSYIPVAVVLALALIAAGITIMSADRRGSSSIFIFLPFAVFVLARRRGSCNWRRR